MAAAQTRSAAARNHGKFEPLRNIDNRSTGRHATCVVEVLSLKVVEYSFQSKGEQILAKKFRCVLTSSNPQEYMYGSIPFDFKNRNAAEEGLKKFTDGSVWEIISPAFDHKYRALYVGCPKKAVLLLLAPTVMRRIEEPGDFVPLQAVWPNLTVHPPCNLQDTVKMLKMIRQASTTLDVCGKFMERPEQKETTDKKQNKLMVAELVLVDVSHHSFRVSIWGDAYNLLKDVSRGEGISLVGVSAMKDSRDDGFKVNAWHSSLHVILGGDRADSLTQMPASSTNEFVPATSTFTPQIELVEVQGEALHSCAAALAEVPNDMPFLNDKRFQLNRCLIEAPISRGAITTEKADLYIRATLHDWSGSVEVEVVEDACVQLFGCKTKSEVLAACDDDTLGTQLKRVNVRGVLRQDARGKVRKFVAQITVSPESYAISARAMRSSLGLAQPVTGVVLADPITRVAQNPMHGLTVRVDTRGSAETQLLGAHRVLLLVQGTTKSSVERVNEKDDPDAFCVTSSNAKCLLDEGLGQEVHLELRGYCDMDTMLDFRLDMETAIVMVSSLESEGGRCAAAVEWVRKIELHNLGQMRALLDIEWKTALTDLGADVLDSQMSPARPEYWESDGQPPARKIRRVDSDPQSPAR